uniref:OTU domain-containing protein n=1 Tax=Gongylonema pulchrum TaxID=637853 RepID=A0A183CYK3_9BILA
LLDEFAANKYKNEKAVLEIMNEEGRSNYYVTFFRLITSGHLRENADEYEGFIDGGRTVVQFCQSEVEPVYKDCDHLAIIALTKAIGVSIRIEYMDRTTAPDHGWFYDFIVEKKPPRHFFLYRPGHYDILYKT